MNLHGDTLTTCEASCVERKGRAVGRHSQVADRRSRSAAWFAPFRLAKHEPDRLLRRGRHSAQCLSGWRERLSISVTGSVRL